MFGVMRLILEDEEASISGDEDFFSVARTMPFVAAMVSVDASLGNEGQAACLLCLVR